MGKDRAEDEVLGLKDVMVVSGCNWNDEADEDMRATARATMNGIGVIIFLYPGSSGRSIGRMNIRKE